MPTQLIMPAAAATVVTMNAIAARPSAATAEPALKPNQPNHRMPAPSTVMGTSCGSIFSPFLRREPIMSATTRAETPDEIWTTVPPA